MTDTPKKPMKVHKIDTKQTKKPDPNAKPPKMQDPNPKQAKVKKTKYDPLRPDLGFVTGSNDIQFPKLKREEAVKILDQYGLGYEGRQEGEVGAPSKRHKGISKYMLHYFNSHPVVKATLKQTVVGFTVSTVVVNAVGDMPDFEGFSMHLGLYPSQISKRADMKNEDLSPYFSQEFREAYDECKKIQRKFIVDACAKGFYTPVRTKYILQVYHGIYDVDKTETIDGTKKAIATDIAEAIKKAENKEEQDNLKSMYFGIING